MSFSLLPISPGIAFDEEGHAYAVDGKPFPSVSKVLRSAGFEQGPPTWALPEEDRLRAMARGSAVHACCDILDGGDDLDWFTVDAEVQGYVEGYQRWRREVPGLTLLQSEIPVASRKYRYCGTPDRIFLDRFGSLRFVDLKTGSSVNLAAATLQVTAYMLAWMETYGDWLLKAEKAGKYRATPPRLSVLHLREDGTFTQHLAQDATGTWLACVRIHQYKEKK